MSLLPFFSTTAIVIGLAAALPQLAAMLNARSAAGQSALGWSLGAFVNCLMAYVNYVGYGAKVLAAGNVASVGICLSAVALVVRFGDAAAPAEEPASAVRVDELPTTEFHALRDLLEDEARRRDERRVLVAA
jgi:hypothetical protein